MSFTVPDTLKETLSEESLAELDAVLGPPADRRATGRYEIEIEAAGEGTFTVTYDAGETTAKKGFAKGDPWVSCAVPRGGFELVRQVLQAAVDGFPDAPGLQQRMEASQKLSSAEWDKMAAAVDKLRDVMVTAKLDGAGTYQVARGALDEATRELELSLKVAVIEDVLGGEDPAQAAKAKLGGDRGVATELAAAFGPLQAVLKR
jgi:hypothetical protein